MGKKEAQPQAERPKRTVGQKIRRVLKWFLLSLFALIVLVVIFIHTPPGQNLIRGIVEDLLAERVNGSVEVGDLDFTLFGHIRVAAVEIRDGEDREAISVGSLDVDLAWGDLLGGTLRLEEVAVKDIDVHVVMTQTEDGQMVASLQGLFKPSDEPPSDSPAYVDKLLVGPVNVYISLPDGGKAHLGPLELEGNVEAVPLDKTLKVALEKLALSLDAQLADGTTVALGPLATSITLDQQGGPLKAYVAPIHAPLVIQRPGKEPVDLTVELAGINADAGKEAIDAKLSKLVVGAVKLAEIAVAVKLGEDGKPKGDQRASITGLELTGAQANAILGQELLKTDAVFDFVASGTYPKLTLNGGVKTGAGTATLTGWVDLTNPLKPKYDITISAEDIRAVDLLVNPPVPLATGLTLHIWGEGLKPEDLNTRMDLRIGETSVGEGRKIEGVAIKAHAQGGGVKLEQFVLEMLGHKITIDGEIDPSSGRIRGRLTTRADLVKINDRLQKAGILVPRLPDLKGGELDVDVTIDGTLSVPMEELAKMKPEDFATMTPDQLPVKKAQIVGKIRGKDIDIAGKKVGAYEATVDLSIEDGQPAGRVVFHIEDIEAGPAKVKSVDGEFVSDGKEYTITVKVDAKEGHQGELAMKIHGEADLETRVVTAEVQELTGQLGPFATKLLAPVKVVLPPGLDLRNQRVTLPPVKVELAGGVLSLSGWADLIDTGNPEMPLGAKELSATVAVDGLQLGKLPPMVRAKLRGMRGTISGRVDVTGSPEDPNIKFGGSALIRGFLLRASGRLGDGWLALELDARKGGTRVGSVEVRAPVKLKPKPGLGDHGELELRVDIPDVRLARLGLKQLKTMPNARVSGHVDLRGRPNRLRGTYGLKVRGLKLPQLGDSVAADIRGSLTPHGRGARSKTRLEVRQSPGAEPLLAGDAEVTFARSPVKSPRTDLTVKAKLDTIDLAKLPLEGLPKDLAGKVDMEITARRKRGRLSGSATLNAGGVKIKEGLPLIDLASTLGFDLSRGITFDTNVQLDGQDVAKLAGGVDVPISRLMRLAKRPKRLAAALAKVPLRAELSIPTRTMTAWRGLLDKLPELPGQFGGSLKVAGKLSAPKLDGALVYDGFDTLAGKPGRIAYRLGTGEGGRHFGRLEVGQPQGGKAPIRMEVAVLQTQIEKLMDAFKKDEYGELDLHVSIFGKRSTLEELLPSFATGGKKLPVKGVFSGEMNGVVALYVSPRGVMPRELRFDGDIGFSEGELPLPGTSRVFRDIALRLGATPGKFLLKKLHVAEQDEDSKRRTIDLSGHIALEGVFPTAANFTFKAENFLLLGPLDAPQAELNGEFETSVSFDDIIPTVTIVAKRMDLWMPSRFVYDHYQEMLGSNDVYFIEDDSQIGKLRPVANPLNAIPAELELPEGTMPVGADIVFKIPEAAKARVVNWPVEFWPAGDLFLKVRANTKAKEGEPALAVNTSGGWKMLRGRGKFLGGFYKLRRGHLKLDGPVKNFELFLQHERELIEPVKRRQSKKSSGGPQLFTVKMNATGQHLIIGGASGAYLVDAMPLQAAGGPQYDSGPGFRTSDTVQLRNGDQPLVLSFVITNLSHLAFLTHMAGWAEPGALEPQDYGRVRNLIASKWWDRDRQRFRIVQRDDKPAENVGELQYDYMLSRSERTLFGLGVRTGTALSTGLELFLEWSSDD